MNGDLLHSQLEFLTKALERIADAQESLLAIAVEARGERMKMAAKMADALKRPIQEK